MSALIWLSYASLLVLGMLDNIRGPFFPEILLELKLSGTAGSSFFAVTSLLAFIGSWSSHRIIEKRSSLFLLGISCSCIAIGFVWIAFAHNLALLLCACALFGWAFGALNLAQNVMVFEASPVHLRRRLFSGLHSMYALSAVLAPLIATLFRDLGLSWRQCFCALAVLPLAVALAGTRLRSQKQYQLQVTPALTRPEWLRCLLYSLMIAGYLWGEISVSTRMVLWLRSELDFSPDLANFYLAGFFLALLIGRIFFSLVHFPRLGSWLIMCLSAGVSALLYVLALNGSPLWLVLSGLSMAPFFPVAMEQLSTLFGASSARALGFVLGFGSLSIVLLHLVIGVFTDSYGIGRALRVGPIALGLIFMALAVVILRREFQGRQKVELKSR